jgi:hypothetical protein
MARSAWSNALSAPPPRDAAAATQAAPGKGGGAGTRRGDRDELVRPERMTSNARGDRDPIRSRWRARRSWSGPRLDSLVMEPRDRLTNLALFAAAGVVWVLVALVVTTRDPRIDPTAGYVGALLIGLAIGLTVIPLFWLAIFARHKRIAYRGDWTRAVRRGGWVTVVTAVFVILRLQQVFVPAIALLILALVVIAEVTLSVER